MTLTEAIRTLNKAGRLMYEDLEDEDVAAYLVRVCGGYRKPDPREAAQRGRLLALLRHAAKEPTVTAIYWREQWELRFWDPEVEDLDAWQPNFPYVETGKSEGEAIAAGFISLAQAVASEAA